MAITRRKDDTPAKRRNAYIRSCAEVIRFLGEKSHFDVESRDMTAFLVISLRGIYDTINESAHAWDDRNYWKKAEALRERWRWSKSSADRLEKLLLKERWDAVPEAVIELVPYLGHVTINATTRDADWWCGAYQSLVRQSQKADPGQDG